jgi:hypothetical protein
MTTITEDYVSFEIAKLLKENGFDVKCDKCYAYFADDDIRFLNLKYPKSAQLLIENRYPCITLQMAMKWLREVHYIHTEICLYKTSEDDIEPKRSRKAPYYTFGIWDSVTGDNVDKRLTNDFIGDTYEQACEAAIKYCLENLI